MENEIVKSQSERQILDMCIELMHELTGYFEEYLEWQGITKEDYEPFGVSLSYFEIVQTLFLFHTSHSGGTSTMQKCRELGVDSSERVIFKVWEEEEEEQDE